jgi:hypothetical protein
MIRPAVLPAAAWEGGSADAGRRLALGFLAGCGSQSTRSPMMLRCIWLVPPVMVAPRLASLG